MCMYLKKNNCCLCRPELCKMRSMKSWRSYTNVLWDVNDNDDSGCVSLRVCWSSVSVCLFHSNRLHACIQLFVWFHDSNILTSIQVKPPAKWSTQANIELWISLAGILNWQIVDTESSISFKLLNLLVFLFHILPLTRKIPKNGLQNTEDESPVFVQFVSDNTIRTRNCGASMWTNGCFVIVGYDKFG